MSKFGYSAFQKGNCSERHHTTETSSLTFHETWFFFLAKNPIEEQIGPFWQVVYTLALHAYGWYIINSKLVLAVSRLPSVRYAVPEPFPFTAYARTLVRLLSFKRRRALS